MATLQIDLTNKKQVRDFLSLPTEIYRSIPQWVPPLDGEERERLNPKRYPYFRHSRAGFFIVYRDGIPVGRLAVLDNRPYNDHNREQTAFFYLFECEPDPNSAGNLFDMGVDWAQKRGLKKILGSKGFTALDGMGILVKGFDLRPALGSPYNPPYYVELVESTGFIKTNEIVSGYLGADIHFPERIHDLAERIRERRGLYIRRFHSRRELRSALGSLKSLYNGALEGTAGAIPISDEEIKALANQILWFADPNLIKIVMKEQQPVGFLLAYPDISAALQRTRGRLFPFGWITLLREFQKTDHININGAGMIQEFRGSGGTAILYSEMFKSVIENPKYQHAEVVQIGMENEKMQREMENFGVNFYKVHGMYEKVI